LLARVFVSRLEEFEKGATSTGNYNLGGKVITIVKTYMLVGTFGKIAKCSAQQFAQFNGKLGCSKCSQAGKSSRQGLSNPYIASNPKHSERNDADTQFSLSKYEI